MLCSSMNSSTRQRKCRASGIPVDLETANVYDFEGERIKRIRIFSDRREALQLLGMPE